MVRYCIPVWEMCSKALTDLQGNEKYVPLIDIVHKIHQMYPNENVNETTIRCQIISHCINRHPSHDKFPDKGKKWKKTRLFITDGNGRYRFYNEEKDREIFNKAVEEDR